MENTKELFKQKETQGEVLNSDEGKILNDLTANTRANEFNAGEEIKQPQKMANDLFDETPLENAPFSEGFVSNGVPAPQQLNASLFSEEFVVFIFDVIISRAFQIGFSSFLNVKISHKEFSLDASERKQLEPIFNEMLKRWNIDLSNPYIAFGVFATMIYGSKAMTVYEMKREEIEQIKQDKKNNIIPEKKKETRGRPRKLS